MRIGTEMGSRIVKFIYRLLEATRFSPYLRYEDILNLLRKDYSLIEYDDFFRKKRFEYSGYEVFYDEEGEAINRINYSKKIAGSDYSIQISMESSYSIRHITELSNTYERWKYFNRIRINLGFELGGIYDDIRETDDFGLYKTGTLFIYCQNKESRVELYNQPQNKDWKYIIVIHPRPGLYAN